MINKLRLLIKLNILTPNGLYTLIQSIRANGINLMALLGFSARLYPQRIAVQDDSGTLTYAQLYQQSRNIASALCHHHRLKPGHKVALICRNHALLLKSLFACSYAGADIYLLNTEINLRQFSAFIDKHQFDLIIHDANIAPLLAEAGFSATAIPAENSDSVSIQSYAHTSGLLAKQIKHGPGKIIVLTSGSTGDFKAAARKPSLFAFLNPLYALLTKLELFHYRSIYIATPVYHGFGLATLSIATLMGATVYLTRKFDADNASHLIAEHQIEVITLVPLMLSRMLYRSADKLLCLRCIISGGAQLQPRLVADTRTQLGDKLFNLYGTSEAGICTIATPRDLAHSASTIGIPIEGLTIQLLDNQSGLPVYQHHVVGRLAIKCPWAAQNNGDLIETGDLGFHDADGYYYLSGRADSMIVSGGENVYPVELEDAITQHPIISECVVIGIPNAEFGQRLKAFIVTQQPDSLTAEQLKLWLSERIARYQMPEEIVFLHEIPLTPIGKPDLKYLSQQITSEKQPNGQE